MISFQVASLNVFSSDGIINKILNVLGCSNISRTSRRVERQIVIVLEGGEQGLTFFRETSFALAKCAMRNSMDAIRLVFANQGNVLLPLQELKERADEIYGYIYLPSSFQPMFRSHIESFLKDAGKPIVVVAHQADAWSTQFPQSGFCGYDNSAAVDIIKNNPAFQKAARFVWVGNEGALERDEALRKSCRDWDAVILCPAPSIRETAFINTLRELKVNRPHEPVVIVCCNDDFALGVDDACIAFRELGGYLSDLSVLSYDCTEALMSRKHIENFSFLGGGSRQDTSILADAVFDALQTVQKAGSGKNIALSPRAI